MALDRERKDIIKNFVITKKRLIITFLVSIIISYIVFFLSANFIEGGNYGK